MIAESHYIDVKREIGSTASKRRDTAKDLASFAQDGGSLLIGVHEDKPTQTFELSPQALDGLVERIDQVAAMSIDPPLSVASVVIPSKADPSVGYVLVHVPPSALAPHMVDGRYFARADRTTRMLSDAEVIRLHAQRGSVEQQIERLLDAEIGREPVPAENRARGHMYLVAQPSGGPRRLAHSLVRPDAWALHKLIRETRPDLASPRIEDWAPTPEESASSAVNRSNGAALHNYSLSGPGRSLAVFERGQAEDDGSILDIEVRDDGGLRILVGRMTSEAPDRWSRATNEVILDGLAVAYARRLVHWAVEIGNQCGWRGTWLLGLHGDRLRGLGSFATSEGIVRSTDVTFDEEVYREVTTASHAEMESQPGVVAYRLVGRLVETLGNMHRYRSDLAVRVAGES